jgi:hypothetical protein
MKTIVPRIAKKPVLVRVPRDIYEILLAKSAKETMKRGETTISVPKLIVEILIQAIKPEKEYEEWLS